MLMDDARLVRMPIFVTATVMASFRIKNALRYDENMFGRFALCGTGKIRGFELECG